MGAIADLLQRINAERVRSAAAALPASGNYVVTPTGQLQSTGGDMGLIGGVFDFVSPAPAIGGASLPTIGGVSLQGLAQAGVDALVSRLAGAPTANQLQSSAGSPGPAAPAPVQSTPMATTPGACANGCGCSYSSCAPRYIDRSDYFGTPSCEDPCYPRLYYAKDANGDPVARCGRKRRKPRMNPLNPRAAGRAARRLAGAGRAMKRIRKSVNAAARQLK